MGTVETLIVFSALMALIAVVTIGIDWIGKPLKHRRFIPRIYRFDDEKLPVDAYGNTTLDRGEVVVPSVPLPHLQPPPVVVARVPPVFADDDHGANATVPVPVAPATPRPKSHTRVAASQSAFSDRLVDNDSISNTAVGDTSSPNNDEDWLGSDVVHRSAIAGTAATIDSVAIPPHTWNPGMALDTSIDGRKPNLATKAERYWVTTAESVTESHFDDDDIARMAAGKAPRRTNPRSGRAEAMQLTGLRRASAHAEVRMQWPDESVDPWNAS